MLLEDEGDETRPRGCKYPTPPCALATGDDRARLVSANRECFARIHPGTPRVPPRVLASGRKPCVGKYSQLTFKAVFVFAKMFCEFFAKFSQRS